MFGLYALYSFGAHEMSCYGLDCSCLLSKMCLFLLLINLAAQVLGNSNGTLHFLVNLEPRVAEIAVDACYSLSK